jgi:formylglycine-generating enzyme required for sulfatase activity
MAALRIAVKERPQSVSEWLTQLKLRPPSVPAMPEPAPQEAATPAERKPMQIRANPKDGAEMVWVSAGEFLMGSDDYPKEMPLHRVHLDGFWMYKTPVTVAQYRSFCDETRRTMPSEAGWRWRDDHPMVRVSWHDAQAYAHWAGVRLPTEAEWEKAARGTDGRKYPWGNRWDASRLQCSMDDWGDARGTAPAGAYPKGASPCGALDMAGNVWEWTADWYELGYYAHAPKRDPKGPLTGTRRVLRGGCWYLRGSDVFRAAYRSHEDPYGKRNYYGFRCATGPSGGVIDER